MRSRIFLIGMNKPLRVLFVSAEVSPFAKVGGLADVAGSLPLALSRLGVDVRVAMPGYGLALESAAWDGPGERHETSVELNPSLTYLASIWARKHRGVEHWLIDGDEIFAGIKESAAVYSPGRDAYLFFAAALLEACRMLGWMPDVVHCNDWHTGFVPVLMREKGGVTWDSASALYTIHNLAYQGEFGIDTLDLLGLPRSLFNPHQLETYGSVNFLKSGCVFSDQVNTVSPTYAREIQTPEYGCRLEGLMKYLADQGRLSGILNGIDYDAFDPSADPAIAASYSASDLSGKGLCRHALLKELKLPVRTKGPVVGMVTRLSSQKGFDLVLEAAERMLKHPIALVVQGLGDPWAASGLRELEARYPKQVRFLQRFDPELAQRVYAGSDVFLMPSAFEPCGLGQMIAMRYGTIPIARSTGGLADTVFEGDNGFVFEERSPTALAEAFDRACHLFNQKAKWTDLIERAMQIDHSWSISAKDYVRLYRRCQTERVALEATG